MITHVRRAAYRLLHRRATALAHRALTAATRGDCNQGHNLTRRLAPHGPAAVHPIAAVWVDAYLGDVPPPRPDDPYQPCLTSLWTGQAATVNEVPPMYGWLAQLVAARANRDEPMFEALVGAIPAGRVEQYLGELLHMAGVAYLARDDGRDWA